MSTIYTAGYLGMKPEVLSEHMARLGAMLVDVRMSPRSRDPRWAGSNVAKLAGLGRYKWIKELGNKNYKSDNLPIELLNPKIAVGMLRPILEQQSIILLCACAQPEHCHRTVAAKYLSEAFGYPVEHIINIPAPKKVAASTVAKSSNNQMSLLD